MSQIRELRSYLARQLRLMDQAARDIQTFANDDEAGKLQAEIAKDAFSQIDFEGIPKALDELARMRQ